MTIALLHRIAAHAWVYDLIQLLAGGHYVRRRLAAQTARLGSTVLVLDLGGGTGTALGLWPASCTYVCLDVDVTKLRRFRAKHPDGIALLADATLTPIRTGSVDVALCVAVSHHLSDELFAQLTSECARVLKTTGTLLFVDAVWEPTRWMGRLLWRYDRGSHPCSQEQLHKALSVHFENTHHECFAVWHKYLIWVGRPLVADS